MENHSNPAGEGDLPASPLVSTAPAPESTLARRLEKSLIRKCGAALTPEQRLEAQAVMLDSLFTTMLMSEPQTGQVYNEHFNIAVALRAQKQSMIALRALFRIQKQKLPDWM